MPDVQPHSERYRGFDLVVFRRTEGWAWRWTDHFYRQANTNGFAQTRLGALASCREEVDDICAAEAAEVERGLARMG